jgi:tetratricopeptide (TPR) repeat protein
MWLRLSCLLLAVPLLGLGAFGVAAGLAPGHDALDPVRALLDALAPLAGTNARALEKGLAGSPARFALAALGAGALFLAVRPRGGGGRSEAAPKRRKGQGKGGEEAAAGPELSRGARSKAKRAARKLARRGEHGEAGELCFHSGMLEKAVEYFEAGGDFARAALYLKAGQPETAGRIHMLQEKWAEAADCYAKAGRQSVAAEMFEKAGDHRRAGECYAECSFHRQAAEAFAKAHEWLRAARALDEVVAEETARTGTQAPDKEREVRKLVLEAARFYEKGGEREAALRVLERGGCALEAAELASRLGRHDAAAKLFQRAGEPRRAAEALRAAGQGQDAARILGEHLRDRGDHAEAARQLEEAGEPMAAGDLYRQLERFEDAGGCYERAGELVQAGEMLRLAGELARAAELFGKCGQWAQAAECYAEAEQPLEQAHALARATRYVEAARLYRAAGRDDEALEALQQVDARSSDFAAASAVLGEIFLARGQHALALTKLGQALGDAEPARDTLDAHYALAQALEAAGRPTEAAARYQRILAVDFRYRDAEARLAACRAQGDAAPAPAQTAAPGTTRPARYRILGELGRGGMGIVYKAHDTVLDRTVALKVLPEALRENEQALQNFLREAKSAAKLNHPNIVTVYDAGEQDGRYYIAMEYVDGTTLKEILKRRGPVAPGGVLNVLLQLCEALGYAHEQRVVHRDVKTANTMWTRDRKAKIMDFGLAKVVEEVRNHTTLVSGTPYYMSPEQTLGKNVDHRTDIYSLGVTVFELATGTVPFREGNIPYHHVHTPPPDARELNPQLPPLLAQVIARCLEKDPAARFQSTREIAALVKQAVARSSATRGEA